LITSPGRAFANAARTSLVVATVVVGAGRVRTGSGTSGGQYAGRDQVSVGDGDGVRDAVGVGAAVGVRVDVGAGVAVGVGAGVGVGVGVVVVPHLVGLPGGFDLPQTVGTCFELGSLPAPPPGHAAKLITHAATRAATDAAKIPGVAAIGASSWHEAATSPPR
jgi:hypothetical protein